MASEIHKYGTDDGWHGKIEEGGQFPPEKDRYHLYIGLFCPFAHRVNLVRHIKHLTSFITMDVVRPYPKDGGGWRFPATNEEYPNATVDSFFGSKFLSEVYFKDDPDYKGKYSVPLLWDKKTSRIVNNESAEMLRWLPDAFNSLPSPDDDNFKNIDLYPAALRQQIDEITSWMQSHINTGVYKAGFARTQETYEVAIPPLFAALNKIEAILASNGGPYVLGAHLTELDLRLYATIIRFDTVYVQHFKTNLGTIRHDYPTLNNWLKGLYWRVQGFRESTDFKHIKENYTKSHGDVNPLGITPLGPWPEVEEGYEEDWGKVRVGEVRHPKVLEEKV
ncbi:hypothetical protein BU23DRAFT_581764 [Bimuria novae-zelandiae CBS 107.79]|uniref:GST C-terminal domain-containing protein n=1 Tax=Bimuria novae-zelandiae CBS 107.79 TaxID=1447943 RepID=A0A6A5V3W0_9PLEO|nr:hypothetical protein BU23DRAFT_581764 [Bimuria novae-zelandiae CBS 107.79]